MKKLSFKKTICLLLALVCTLACITLPAMNVFAVADMSISSGMTLGVPTEPDPNEVTSGDYIYLPLTEDTAMLVEYLGNDTKITTPSTIDGYKIVSIGDGAFICKDEITEVVISEGVTSIGEYAFCACKSLANVTFPETLVTIGKASFRANFQLVNVNIPDSVEEIQKGAFANTRKLADVKIGTGIKTIGNNAFNKTDILTISGYVNTVACEYAYKNGINFNNLGVAPTKPTEPTQSETDEPTEPTTIEPIETKPTEYTEPTTEVTTPTEPNIIPTEETEPNVTVEKKTNPVKVSVNKVTVNAKKLRGKKQTVKPITVKNAKGKVEIVKVKSGTTSKIYKKISVNKKTGAITFRKGKYAKKTYSIKLRIAAKGNTDYKSKVITKTVKVKIK